MSTPLVAVLCPAPTPSRLACALTEEGLSSSPLACPDVPRPLRRRVLDGCASQGFTASMAFARFRQARLPLGPGSPRVALTARQTSRDATDRRFARLPFVRLRQRASTTGSRPSPPLCYSAAGTLPRPDLHRQAQRGLAGRTGTCASSSPCPPSSTSPAASTAASVRKRCWCPSSPFPWRHGRRRPRRSKAEARRFLARENGRICRQVTRPVRANS